MISLNLFTKCPYSGNPKTRLSPILSRDERSLITRQMIENIIIEINKLNVEKIKKNLYVYPNCSNDFFKGLKTSYQYNLLSQTGPDLISRMKNCLIHESKFADKTILLGMDLPGLTSTILYYAIKTLENNDFVLGPSTDNGFYLIGFKGIYRDVLNKNNLNIYNLKKHIINHNLSLSLTTMLKDIDTPEDFLTI